MILGTFVIIINNEKKLYTMKHVFAAIAFCLLALGTLTAQQGSESMISEVVQAERSGDVPVMTFETTTVEYGTIEKGSDPLRSVSFTNTGTAPLIIKHAKGSCGCTVPDWPKEPILPGETSKIEIRYDTKRVGPIRKTVRITTNEGDKPHILQIKGKVNAANAGETLPKKSGGLIEGGK